MLCIYIRRLSNVFFAIKIGLPTYYKITIYWLHQLSHKHIFTCIHRRSMNRWWIILYFIWPAVWFISRLLQRWHKNIIDDALFVCYTLVCWPLLPPDTQLWPHNSMLCIIQQLPTMVMQRGNKKNNFKCLCVLLSTICLSEVTIALVARWGYQVTWQFFLKVLTNLFCLGYFPYSH